MFKLWSTILKDIRILTRDKLGLIFMFVMPIVLAVVITAVQNSTFEMLNTNTVPMLLCNRDTGEAGKQLETAIHKAGMFRIQNVNANEPDSLIAGRMHAKDAVIAIIIPSDFTDKVKLKSNEIARKALKNFGMQSGSSDTDSSNTNVQPISMLYHPVLQETFRKSIQGALKSALQVVQNKEVLKSLYFNLNEKAMPDSLEKELIGEQVAINEMPVSRSGSRNIPNASQHNVPAWTVFAMFFIVISLGGSVVREKLNGSFVRLKTLPTNYLVSVLSKQLTYLFVTVTQAAVVFSLGIWLFPSMGLPRLNLPDLPGVTVVTLICGWCAVSYAIMIGVFAKTQEQSNGIGAVSIVLMAAVGGLLVPSFAMPESFQFVMKLSPLHWCLEAYYGLFLEGGKLKDVVLNILPLLGITLVIQAITLIGLKRKNLI